MQLWKQYHTPQTIDDVTDLLAQHAGKARIIAGGTDLLVDIRAGHMPPQEVLIDITSVADLCTITPEADNTVRIGAGVTHTQIVKSDLLAGQATCLVESCGVVGGPQVRNVATLGGNVAHALPAGDGTTSLVALDAEVEIFHDGTRKWVPVLEMFQGPGQSLLDPTRDVLLQFRFGLHTPNSATAFNRIMRPQGVALPVLGCSVWLALDDDHEQITDSRICIAPVAPTPVRASEVEAAIQGQSATDETIELAVSRAQETLQPRTSKYRATADYRKEMIAVLLRRTLRTAIQRAKTGESIPQNVGMG